MIQIKNKVYNVGDKQNVFFLKREDIQKNNE